MIENRITISDIKFIPVKPLLGHIGFVSFIFNKELFFSSIAVYTRFNGGYRLVFPRIKDVDVFYPINKELYEVLETKIIEFLDQNIQDVRRNNDNSLEA